MSRLEVARERAQASAEAAGDRLGSAIGFMYAHLVVMTGSPDQAAELLRASVEETIARITDSAISDVLQNYLATGAESDAQTLLAEMLATLGGRS